MKVLLACDGEYRPYTKAIANAIRTFRPEIDVAVMDMQELEAGVEPSDSQLVIVSGTSIPPNPVDIQILGYMELSPESEMPSRFRVGERYWESTTPTLGEILSVVDDVHLLYRMSREQESTATDEEEA